MANLNRQSYAAQLFAEYRNENAHLITKFKNVLSYLKKAENLDGLEKKEVIGGWLSVNSDLGPAFDAIHLNIDRLIETVNNLLECLEKEKKELDKYMKGLKKATAESESNMERLLISYNEKQYYYMQELNSMIPELIELADKAIGMEDLTIAEIGGRIRSAYENLERAIINKNTDKDSLYLILEDVLFKLRDNAKGLGDIISKLGESSNVGIFISNFRAERSLLYKFEKQRKKCGRNKDSDKLFSDLEKKEDVEKLNSFMKGKLEALFDGIKLKDSENKEVEAKKLIGKIIKTPNDLNKLKKVFEEELLKELLAKIRDAGYVFKTQRIRRNERGIDAFKLIKPDGRHIKVSEMKSKDYFKNTDNETEIHYILEELEGALEGKKPWKENASFKNLLQINDGILEKIDAKKSDEKKKIDADTWNRIESNKMIVIAFRGSSVDSDVKLAMSNLMSDLFGGKPRNMIKNDSGKWKCKQFERVLNYRNKNDGSFAHQINEVYSFVESNYSNFESDNLSVWNEFLTSKLEFIF